MPTPKKSLKKGGSASRRGLRGIDDVLLRCATIERRLEGLEAASSILADRVSTLQRQLEDLGTKIRS